MTREAVIVDSKRTGLAKAGRGSLNNTEPVDYLAHTIKAVVEGAEGIIHYANTRVLEWTGFRPTELDGTSISLIVPR